MEILQTILTSVAAIIIAYELFNFLKTKWTQKKIEQKILSGEAYSKEYQSIMKGIEMSQKSSELDAYKTIIGMFEKQYEGTRHELDAQADARILRNILEGKNYIVTGTNRPIFGLY